jgi:hypothetical protein
MGQDGRAGAAAEARSRPVRRSPSRTLRASRVTSVAPAKFERLHDVEGSVEGPGGSPTVEEDRARNQDQQAVSR